MLFNVLVRRAPGTRQRKLYRHILEFLVHMPSIPFQRNGLNLDR